MKNELSMFNFKENNVRVVIKDSEPWFVAKDVAEILGYTVLNKMYEHVDKEDKVKIDPQSQQYQGLVHNGITLETNQNVRILTLINESGLYDAIFGSTLQEAKEFKRWVTSEVLPSIRKHGAYMTPDVLENAIANPDFTIGLLQKLKEQQDENNKLKFLNEEKQKQIIEMKPKVEFADTISASEGHKSIGDYAKTLYDEDGIDVGRNRLFQWLRNNKYLMTNNVPYQKYMDYFKVIEKPYFNNEGEPKTQITTLINGKGRLYFFKKIEEYFGKVKN